MDPVQRSKKRSFEVIDDSKQVDHNSACKRLQVAESTCAVASKVRLCDREVRHIHQLWSEIIEDTINVLTGYPVLSVFYQNLEQCRIEGIARDFNLQQRERLWNHEWSLRNAQVEQFLSDHEQRKHIEDMRKALGIQAGYWSFQAPSLRGLRSLLGAALELQPSVARTQLVDACLEAGCYVDVGWLLKVDMSEYGRLLNAFSVHTNATPNRGTLLHRLIIDYMQAFKSKQQELLQALRERIQISLDRGFEVNAVDTYGNTPLLLLAQYPKPCLEVMRILTEAEADVDHANTCHRTAFYYLSLYNASDEAKACLEHLQSVESASTQLRDAGACL